MQKEVIYGALDQNTTASNNTAVGRFALGANTTGTYNTALGSNAGSSMTTPTYNICHRGIFNKI